VNGSGERVVQIGAERSPTLSLVVDRGVKEDGPGKPGIASGLASCRCFTSLRSCGSRRRRIEVVPDAPEPASQARERALMPHGAANK